VSWTTSIPASTMPPCCQRARRKGSLRARALTCRGPVRCENPEVINLSPSKRFVAIHEEIGLLEFLCQLVLGHLERAPPKNAPMPQELYASVAKRIVAANPVV
jgi:hypothetical protein